MPRSGSRNLLVSVIRRLIWKMLPQARTTSGRTCTRALPRRQRKRASRSWHRNSAWLLPSRSIMRSVIVHCSRTSRRRRSSRRAKSRSGSAATAVISLSVPKHRKFARSALIRRASSRSTLRIIKPFVYPYSWQKNQEDKYPPDFFVFLESIRWSFFFLFFLDSLFDNVITIHSKVTNHGISCTFRITV